MPGSPRTGAIIVSLEYRVFDASRCNFPKPRVPLLSSVFECFEDGESKVKPRLDGGVLHFSRGRYALGEAYRLAKLDGSGALMAPAYHCVTMLDPALAMGAEVVLYPLNADLTPDRYRLDEVYKQSVKPVRVMVATHFFGFIQDFSWLRQWCEEKAIVLVEDCAHVLFTERDQARGAGKFGKFVASSPYKFFPSPDGGFLYAPDARRLDGVGIQSAGFLSELRGIKRSAEISREPKIRKPDIDQIDKLLDSIISKIPEPGNDRVLQRPAQSTRYSADSVRTASLRSSRWVINHSSISGNVCRRQANYRCWLKALSDVPNCHVLYPQLPEHVVPYMLPLYVDFPNPHFYWLKQLGVPIWRWDEMAVSDCQVAHDHRLHLLHLPCHQSLTGDEMNWMIAAVTKVLSLFEEEARG